MNDREEVFGEDTAFFPDGSAVVLHEMDAQFTVLDLCKFLPSRSLVDEYVAGYIKQTLSGELHALNPEPSTD